MANDFILSSRVPVYLYGAASVGKTIFERNKTLNICGFIDKRAEEIKDFMGLPVYTLEQASKKLDKRSVIILSIKNVFELEKIAESLYETGFDKLIYKSRAVLQGQGDTSEKNISKAWEMIVEGRFTPGITNLPRFQNNIKYDFTDRSIVQEDDGTLLVRIPVELIYTNNRNDKWSDINIQGYYPHIYFFYYLLNHKNGQIYDYIKFAEETALEQGDIKITESWKKNVIRNRADVYEHMCLNLDTDPHFFYRNAPVAVWNEKGYFNLTSGKHRCAFLVAHGYRYILLKMAPEEYSKFLLHTDSKSIKSKIMSENIRYLDKKVYHPWFYQYPCSEPKFYSYFQVEALCRLIRFANEHGRIVRLYTNLSKKNSLFIILKQCRLVQMTDLKSAECLLLDEWSEKDKLGEQQYSDTAILWRISSTATGNVLSEYLSREDVVYFCEG